MTWQLCWYYIQADLFQATGRSDIRTLIRRLWSSPTTRFLVAFRIGAWACLAHNRSPVHLVARWLHKRWSIRYNIEIPVLTSVGPGLVINHLVGGIIVSQQARLGSRVRLNPGVLIGIKPQGAPVIEDDVVLTNSAKVIGAVTVGAGAIVGTAAVVTKDVPADAAVAGVPARVVGIRPRPARAMRNFESHLGPTPSG